MTRHEHQLSPRRPFRVRVPATSANLGPGFDCLGIAVSLYLTLECRPAESFGIELSGEGSTQLPHGAENLLARCLQTGMVIGSGTAAHTAAARSAAAHSAAAHSSAAHSSAAHSSAARSSGGHSYATIVSQALAHIESHGTSDLPAVRLSIHNDIPLARGLGSSSAAIIAGLATGMMLARPEQRAAAQRVGEPAAPPVIDRGLICEAANRIEGHPDNVTAAALGDFVISGAEQGELITLALCWPASVRFVAIIPELAIRTEDARRALPREIAFGDAVLNGSRLARLLGALQSGHFEQLRTALDDRLHQPYRLPLATGLAEAVAALSGHPRSLGAYLSGSGPTVIALCQHDDDALGDFGVQVFASCGVKARAVALQVDRSGLMITTEGIAQS